MFTFSISAQEFKALAKSLKSNLSNLQVPFESYGNYFIADTLKQYRQERSPSGDKWQPLAPATIKRKKSKGYPLSILIAKGKMINSFRKEVTKDKLTISNTAEYFDFHQEGTGRIPQRVIVGMNRDRAEEKRKIFTVWLKGRIPVARRKR